MLGGWSSSGGKSAGNDNGDGGGRNVAELTMLGGVDVGEGGGLACRRRFVRRETKKADRR